MQVKTPLTFFLSHPYILAMLGYSRPGDPGEASYIVTEGTPTSYEHHGDRNGLLTCSSIDYHPFINYLSSFHGTKKLRVFIQMVRIFGTHFPSSS